MLKEKVSNCKEKLVHKKSPLSLWREDFVED
jgi:hypothetical protein